MIYLFNQFQIDTNNFVIKSNGEIIETEPQVFNLIVFLIENKSRLVSREELIKNVWHGRVVLDATLSNHIKNARQVLGDDGTSQKVIKTVHGRGYQFEKRGSSHFTYYTFRFIINHAKKTKT